VGFVSLAEGIDATTPAGRLQLHVLGAIAEFERERIRERVLAAAKKNKRLGEVQLSVNPFIPKPFTPFQWCGMEPVKSLESKWKYLQKALGKLSNLKLQMESPREAYQQALLSRGDRRLAQLLVLADRTGSWKQALREVGFDCDAEVHRQVALDEPLPWDFIDGGDSERLKREYRRAFEEEA
jgi:radical SAM superfamily enzyme YgiQ (UPF0313 family)